MPYLPITPLPEPPSITSSSSSSGSGALCVMIGVILLFVRVMRCDSSPSYDDAPKPPKFDPHITRELLEYRPLPDYSELYRIAPQPPLFSPTASEETLYWEMEESLGALQHYSIASSDQRTAAALLESEVAARSCGGMRKAFAALEKAEPVQTGDKMRAEEHLTAIDQRLEIVCPPPKKKPKKKKREP